MIMNAGVDVSEGENLITAIGSTNQTGTTSMEISVEIPLKEENRFTVKSSYTTLWHLLKALFILAQR